MLAHQWRQCICAWATCCRNASFERSWRASGDLSYSRSFSIWRKSIFSSARHSGNHIFPAAGTGPPRWPSHFDMVAKVCFRKQRLHVQWAFICIRRVCVCSLWDARKQEQWRCRNREEGKGSRRRWKRESLERKVREHKGTRAQGSILQAIKKKCRGREKEGIEETWTPNPPPAMNTHWLMNANSRAILPFFPSVFTVFCITWHSHMFTTEWLWRDMVLRHSQ